MSESHYLVGWLKHAKVTNGRNKQTWVVPSFQYLPPSSFIRPFLRWSRRSTLICTAWRSWSACSRTLQSSARPWPRLNTTTSSQTSPTSVRPAKSKCVVVLQCVPFCCQNYYQTYALYTMCFHVWDSWWGLLHGGWYFYPALTCSPDV